jgi:hypothetical protein
MRVLFWKDHIGRYKYHKIMYLYLSSQRFCLVPTFAGERGDEEMEAIKE